MNNKFNSQVKKKSKRKKEKRKKENEKEQRKYRYQKPVRLFASFRNKKHQDERFDDIINKMPKKYKFDLVLFIGQLESSLIEGYGDDKNEK